MNISATPSGDFELLHLDDSTAHPSSNDSPDHSATLAVPDQPSVLPSDKKERRSEEIMDPPPFEIDSFVPVIDQLSNAIRLSDKSLHIRGAVSKADLDALSSFTRGVGTFVLTDSPKPLGPQVCTISPGTYIRLAQLHNPDTPFFPSLQHLRIIDADSSLTHLNFLLTDSLRSIELINLNDSNKEAFLSFLISLADECPRLSSITLGQNRGRHLSSSLLNHCLTFGHLRELELKDVLSALDFQLFVTIGKALPELESFILNARTAEYSVTSPQPAAEAFPAFGSTPDQGVPQGFSVFGSCGRSPPWPPSSPHESPSRTPVEYLFQFRPPLLSSPRPDPIPLVDDGKPSSLQLTEEPELSSPCQTRKEDASFIPPPPSFSQLKKLHVTGKMTLIEDLVGYIGSTTLEDVALTLVRSTRPKIVQEWKDTPNRRWLRGVGNQKLVLMSTTVPVDVESPSFVSFVEEAVHATWKTTLTKLYLGQHQDYRLDRPTTDDATPPTLQFALMEKILSHPTLEYLEVSGWKIDSLSTLPSHLSSSSSKLKVLHLPIGTANRGISLSDLRLFAESCPNMVSLQSTITDLHNIPLYDHLKGASNALSHGLETLSVGNAMENSNPKEILDVARHLFILFPYLKEIRTHKGQNEEQWKYIHSLVQMFQTVRLDDAARLHARKD